MEYRFFVHSDIGCDENDGTVDNPFRTITGMIRAIILDDKVYIMNESVIITVIYWDKNANQWRQL
jgi:hypothetical protein